MPLIKNKGCDTPLSGNTKQIYDGLTQLFAPILFFHPKERFYPVDLKSTVDYAGLWHTNLAVKPPNANQERDFGKIEPLNHFPPTNENHFISIVGNDFEKKQAGTGSPFLMPKPNPDKILKKIIQQTNTKLTMYATVCKASEVPNRHFFQGNVRHPDVIEAIDRGLFINYYFYFPAYDSPEFQSEGDWSGITLLLKDVPGSIQDLKDAKKVKIFQPILACYYHKTILSAPPSLQYYAGDKGFRLWKDVKRVKQTPLNLDTHPIVYISRGRHNCHYEPFLGSIPLTPPVGRDTTKIEEGKLKTGPTEPVLQGGDDVPGWFYALFPPFAVFTACATGCQGPVKFDKSGVPWGIKDGEDQAGDGGHSGVLNPNASDHPQDSSSKLGSAKQLNIQLKYVDTSDTLMNVLWGFPGAWGGACFFNTTPKWDKEDPRVWGYYRGIRRPSLAPWFYLSLLIDYTYGAGGILKLSPSP